MKKIYIAIISLLGISVVFLSIYLWHGNEENRVQYIKVKYSYDKWNDIQKIKGQELLLIDGDLDIIQPVFRADELEDHAHACRKFLMGILGTSKGLMAPMDNWWSMAGIGDLCLIDDEMAPKHCQHPMFAEYTKKAPLMPLEEHYDILYCKMGNFILNTYYKTSRKEEWDALRLIDRVFYTPNSLSPPSPDISWILKRRPFAGWELTLDSVPPDSIYFLQGTGVSLKRLGGTSSIIYDPFRSAIIKPKWGTAKQELLLNVVGRDCQKRTFKVDLNQAEIDWPWCATRLVLPLFLIGVVIRVGWLFYRKRKRRLSHKTK